jgi:hypothetical protein
MEDLLQFHQFVKASSLKNDPYLSQKNKKVENDILNYVFNLEAQTLD